jgi:hypothetical protein
LANVISITNIYGSVQTHVDDLNTSGVYYDVARLIRILIDFDPIEYSIFYEGKYAEMSDIIMREYGDYETTITNEDLIGQGEDYEAPEESANLTRARYQIMKLQEIALDPELKKNKEPPEVWNYY